MRYYRIFGETRSKDSANPSRCAVISAAGGRDAFQATTASSTARGVGDEQQVEIVACRYDYSTRHR
jgi:hypothetical protein